MRGIEIKRLSIDDLPLLAEWRMEVLRHVFGDRHLAPDEWQELKEANIRYFRSALPTGNHVAIIARRDGEAIGCGAMCIHHEMPSPDNISGKCAYLMNIYVREEARGNGVGRQIVEWLTRHASQRGITKTYLETTPAGRHLYETTGFTDMEEMMIHDNNAT